MSETHRRRGLAGREQRHTPGPWEIDGDLILGPVGSGNDYHREDDGYHATICSQESGDTNQWRANARLIAAAPALLEAVKEALAIAESDWQDMVSDSPLPRTEEPPHVLVALRAAISLSEPGS